MKKLLIAVVILGIALGAAMVPASAEEKAKDETKVKGESVSGVQTLWEKERSSKFFEYRDVPKDVIFNSFRLSVEKGSAYVKVLASGVRQADARYDLTVGQYGTYKLDLTYDRIPHRFSFFGKTLYAEPQVGGYTLPDQLQLLLQNAVGNGATNSTLYMPVARTLMKDFLSGVHDVGLGLQRNKYALNFNYNPVLPLTLNFKASRENRDGTRPFGTSFGFSHVLELPEPIHYTTTELNASAEYAQKWGTLQAGYYVSLFDNGHESLTWDNPYRLTDQTFSGAYSNGNGAAQGRMALAPSNSAQKFYFNGSARILKFTWLYASVSYGTMSQNASLLPYTTNTAIAGDPAGYAGALSAPRATAEAKAHVTNLDFTLTSKIISHVYFTAGYRSYDFANKTEPLDVPGRARFDQVWETTPDSIALYSFTRSNLFADLKVNLIKNTSLKFSYSYATIERSEGAAAESGEALENKDKENTFKVALDTNPMDWVNVRVSYLNAKRDWSLDGKEYAYASYFNFKRYFVASRDRQGLNVLVGLDLVKNLDLEFSYMLGKDKYPESDYGLKNYDFTMYGLDLSYALDQCAAVYGFYSHELYKGAQASRQTNTDIFSPDPGDDWGANIKDTVNTYGAGLNTILKKDVLNLDLSYSYSRATGDAILSSAPGGLYLKAAAVQFTRPLDQTDLQTIQAKLTWKLMEHFSMALGYWYEQYKLKDIVRNDISVDWIVPASIPGGASGASAIFLGAI
jgi:MtrB/PioB family decaheme-associated outer membrane protein